MFKHLGTVRPQSGLRCRRFSERSWIVAQSSLVFFFRGPECFSAFPNRIRYAPTYTPNRNSLFLKPPEKSRIYRTEIVATYLSKGACARASACGRASAGCAGYGSPRTWPIRTQAVAQRICQNLLRWVCGSFLIFFVGKYWPLKIVTITGPPSPALRNNPKATGRNFRQVTNIRQVTARTGSVVTGTYFQSAILICE